VIHKLGEGVTELAVGKCDGNEPHVGSSGALHSKGLGMFMDTPKT